ncbi:hypothetical protein [Streptomyces sp. SD15]
MLGPAVNFPSPTQELRRSARSELCAVRPAIADAGVLLLAGPLLLPRRENAPENKLTGA